MNGKQLKNSTLQWAIQGRLVPQDPADEPASVLLERIRQEKACLVKEGKIKRDKTETIIYRGADNSHYEKSADGTVRCIDEEIPFEIPENWAWCRLGSIVTLLSGRDLEPSKYNSMERGIPYMTGASNFNEGSLMINRWTEYPITISHKGDLLITCKGTIGTMAFNDIGDIHIARQIMAITTSFINIKYIRFFLCWLVEELQKKAKSIIPGITREDTLSSYISLPPLAEQQRIVAKLEEVLPVVDRYDKAQVELDSLNDSIKDLLKKSILQEAIQGRLVPQLDGEEPVSELLKRIAKEKQDLLKQGKLKAKDITSSAIFRGDDNRHYEKVGKETVDITDNIPFEIPESWRWARIGDIFAHNNGKQLNKGNSSGIMMEYITTSNLYWDGFILQNLKRMPFEENEVERCQAIKGDLLVCEGGDVGRSCIWNYDFPIMLQNHIHKLRAYNTVCTKYFYYTFYFYNLIGIIGGKGIGIQGFSSKALHNTLVPAPPIEEQQRIVGKVDELFAKIDGR